MFSVLLRLPAVLLGSVLENGHLWPPKFQREQLPDFGTWLTTLCVKAEKGTDLEYYSKAWVRARHDSGVEQVLAHRNKLADAKATEYLERC